jgi:hypothetical protein
LRRPRLYTACGRSATHTVAALSARAFVEACAYLVVGPARGSLVTVVGVGSGNGQRGTKPPRREGRRIPPLCNMGDLQRREFQEALLDAHSFEDLPGKWQAAIVSAEQNQPKLRVVRRG